jgi:transposase
MVNIYGEKLNTYAAFNLISLNKKYYVNNTNEDYYDVEKDYKETLIKSTYIINPKALFKIGYLVREMNDTNVKNEISFVQGQYKVNNSALVFVKYIKNTGKDFSDRRLDADNNMIDLDFDSSTGVIREAVQGRIEFGIELVF